MVIIGSTALKHWFPKFNREPKDLDIAVASGAGNYTGKSGKRVEKLLNPVIVKYAKGQEFLSPELLLTLKMSHLSWDISFEKHMWDVQFLLKQGINYDESIMWELYDYWETYHGKNKKSDLTLSKKDFFNNALKTFDHDYLHTLITPEPTYLGMLKEGCDVELDPEKFSNSSDLDKNNLIREEIYVMAFERYRHLDYRLAYSKMIKKYLMSHVPNFAYCFLINNWIELHSTRRFNFIEAIESHPRFNNAYIN